MYPIQNILLKRIKKVKNIIFTADDSTLHQRLKLFSVTHNIKMRVILETGANLFMDQFLAQLDEAKRKEKETQTSKRTQDMRKLEAAWDANKTKKSKK